MKINLFLVLATLLFHVPVKAQILISGKLLNENQQPISDVSVSYRQVGATVLSGFTKTDSQGKFELKIKKIDTDSLQLDFNHMSYAKKSVTVVNAAASYAYVLHQQARQIEEVKIANMPVYKRKDTINYNVNVFTSAQDRVIGDIIKKLPGIEIKGDQILYQGKPIQKYMVNNLDLMEGRYGMINKNLPADAVKKVQIVENDQPIKILDSLASSDRATLNLELKKFTSTGTGQVGAGLSPALWNLNFTPMTFGKTFQMLNSFQTNNIGYDASRELRPFYTGGSYFFQRVNINDGPSYIGLKNVSSPSFDEKKWLENKIFLFSSNMLQKLNSATQLKANLSYYDDSRKRRGFTATQYFTSDDIILNSERINNSSRSKVFDAGVLIEKNEKNIYLRNYLKYRKKWDAGNGDLVFNETDNIQQRRHYTDEALLNSLSLGRLFGKQLVDIQSTLEYHSTPQGLSVQPGQFQDIINAGEPYDQVKQTVIYKGLSWNNSLGFARKVKEWSFAPKLAVNYETNDLQSGVTVWDDNEKKQLGADYRNDMRTSSLNLAFALRIGWEKQNWKLNINMPYNVFIFDAMQHKIPSLNKEHRNTFNPGAYLNYKINAYNELTVDLAGNKQYGGLNNLYDAFIISQYRTMQRYNSRLLGTENLRSTISYNYRNTRKANFANMSYSFTKAAKDYMFTTHIDEQSRTTSDIKDQRSRSDVHTLHAGTSRLIADIKTVIKLSGSTSWSSSDYLLNDVLAKQQRISSAGALEIINNLSSILSGDYKLSLGQSSNRFATGKRNKITYSNHYLNLAFYPLKNNSLLIHNTLYGTNIPQQKDQFFMDATYRYTVNKWKTDIELSALNLWNNNDYIQQFNSNYEFIQSHFELRPRQFMISTRFKF